MSYSCQHKDCLVYLKTLTQLKPKPYLLDINLLYLQFSQICKANGYKTHLLLSYESDADVTANLDENIISNKKSEKLFRVATDCTLTFDEHVSRICDKASQNLSVLDRIFSFVKPVQKSK